MQLWTWLVNWLVVFRIGCRNGASNQSNKRKTKQTNQFQKQSPLIKWNQSNNQLISLNSKADLNSVQLMKFDGWFDLVGLRFSWRLHSIRHQSLIPFIQANFNYWIQFLGFINFNCGMNCELIDDFAELIAAIN